MDLVYNQCLLTAFNPAHIQLSIDGIYLALPITRTTIGVWSLQDISCKPVELEGHRKILTCMRLGNKTNPKLLCSAADDYIIVWNVQLARQMIEKGRQVRGQIIGTTLGCIHYCSFNPDDKLVAACCDNNVMILQSETEKIVATLEGHTGRVTAAEFCPHYSSTLVTISEDRTFKIWDINDLSLVYQSTIITASPFISMAMNLLQPHVAIGTADGQVRIYDLTDGNNFRCLHHIDVSKLERKQKEKKEQLSSSMRVEGPVTISSKPSWQRLDQMAENQQNVDEDFSVEAGCAVLGIQFTYLPKNSDNTTALPSFLQNNHHSVIRDVLDVAPMLVIGTTGAMFQINAKTLDLCRYVDLHDPITSVNGMKTEEKQINLAGSVYFGQGANPYQVYCVIGSHFQNIIHLLHWKHGTVDDKTRLANRLSAVSLQDTSLQDDGDSKHTGCSSINEDTSVSENENADGLLTVLSNTPLLEDSPLRAELVKKVKEDPKTKKPKGYLTPTPKKPGQILDKQPLTFHSKVKSSGYTAAPRTTMFKPQTSMSKPATPVKSSRSNISTLEQKAYGKQYPVNSDPPSVMKIKVDVAERPTAINKIKFSDDGKHIACALANKSAQIFKMPLTGKGSSLVGHNHAVNGVSWSHDSNWIITSSEDKTASVWGHGQSDPLMTFGTVLNNFSVDKESQKVDKDNGPFPKEVKFAQFYYMDKFILLTSGNTLYMYKYLLDPSKQDIKRYLSGSKYKLVTSFSTGAQQITSLSAVNGFYSYLVFCSGTNKTLEIYDMNVSKCVRTMSEVHTRPVHVICQNEGSTFVSHPQNSYDLFVTGAAGDCIKLWDLRSNRCVRRYEGHMNRVHPCGLDISSCGKYIATGSEDRSAYIFDVRTGTYCQKLTGHTDVVSDVIFHPLYPQLVTSTVDGKLKLYTDK